MSEVKHKITEFFPDTTMIYNLKLALRGNGVNIYRDINQSNHNIQKFDLRQTLQKYLGTFLKKIAVMMTQANRPITSKY